MLDTAKISEYKIKKIITHFCLDITADRTAYLLGINRNTINHWYKIFRLAVYAWQMKECKKIFGEAEVDESYFGAKRKRGYRGKLKRGRGTQKQPAFGLFKRNGRVYTEIIPNCTKAVLQGIIKGKVDPSMVIYSDKWRGYDGLVDVGYDKHFRVNHGDNEFSKGNGVHINGIENFWSFTKRRLTKFNGVKKNFELHLKESEWRYDKDPKVLEKELWIILKGHSKL
ncbi:MAG: IS1595 family transposase [Candidatus Magasanikbacteria bacterium CG_4_10_14_0_2_um_filter_33_14]|uniref:IS1595 family transposase n=1 Tax=Candidatus Magasanikbacteria bacterium CG_4_10_14_0_2_um_filter_33_14 TaxID=1974636 RepID=A0A2M7V9W0_9BACT|nr:MAG: IS1595 family transposase [Candidatus Magasanikbacteria bacterium CG_4_10_14_0_2_um_filter_33_14]